MTIQMILITIFAVVIILAGMPKPAWMRHRRKHTEDRHTTADYPADELTEQ